MKKITFPIALMILLVLSGVAMSQKKPLNLKNVVRTFIDQTGQEVAEIIVPGKPPATFRMPAAPVSPTAVTLENVPAYDWSFGCSATSAAMQAAYYDRTGYYNIYTGPTQGGLMPMDNSSWGSVVINGETRKQCPLSATRNGVDGRSGRGNVDDYWIKYGSTANDPYITNGWAQHTWNDCTGDYMGTNQSALGNKDGSTTFYFYTNGAIACNYAAPAGSKDGCRGMREFYESRGYTVTSNCTQLIYGYNGNTQGFTFTQYKQEIDAGRPVLIQVEDHTMLGYGYDNTGSKIYLHDTWDYLNHTMTWGGSYSGLAHWGVTTIQLASVTPNPCSNIISLGSGGAVNAKTYWGGGEGEWFTSSANPCGYITPGIEQVYSFVAPFTGVYSIQVTAASGYVDYLWKSSACSSSGWSCIDDINTTGTYGSLSMTAGTTYYFLLDDEDHTEGAHTFYVFLNPCLNITPIGGTGSGNSQSYSGGGNGGWFTSSNSPCGYICSGLEHIYSFVPSVSGLYRIVVTSATGYVDYMWKSASCSSTGWSCIDDIYTSGTYGSLVLQEGITYYLLLDKETTSAGTHHFYLTLAETAGNWEGTVSNDWYNSANWSASFVPVSTTNVTINTGYTYYPIIGSGDAYCDNITIGTGAKLSIGDADLNVTTDMTISGQVEQTNINADFIVGDDVFWLSGSTANITQNGEFHVTGDWEFRNGSAAVLACGYVYFEGTSISYIRSYETNCAFYNLLNSKDNTSLYFSSSSTDTLKINGYLDNVNSTSTFYFNTTYPLVLKGQLYNSGHIVCPYGTFIFDGTAHTVNLNTGDYFNNLIISSTGNVTQSDSLRIHGDLTISSGALVTANYPILIEGDWNNLVGTSGFSEGTGTVVFNGGNYHQYCSSETFNILEVNKPLGGAFRINGSTVICAGYNWTAGAVDVLSGSFTANDLVDNGIFGSYYVNPGGTINLYNNDSWVDLNGYLYIYGGNFNIYGGLGLDSYWPWADNGGITMSGGVLDIKEVGVIVYNTGNFTENITGGTIRTSRGFMVDRSDFTPSGGTVEFYGPVDGSFYTTNSGYVANILINKSATDQPGTTGEHPVIRSRDGLTVTDAPMTATVNMSNVADINGDFTLTSGILNSNSHQINISGNWDNQVGTAGFLEGTGTVVFDGSTGANIVSTETFYNLELNKTYASFNGLNLLNDVTIGNNLNIADGTMELDSPADLTVAGNVNISLNAGLNANDSYGPNIHVGKNWVNTNTTYSSTVGFDPGYFSTVTFNGTTDQEVETNCPQEEFSTLVIDKSAGQFRPNNNIFANRDITLSNGIWEDYIGGLTHTLNRHFTVNSSGSFHNAYHQNTVVFTGNMNSTLTYSSVSGYFHNLTIDKATGYSVTQVGSTSCQFAGNLTIDEGTYQLNGNYLYVTGDLNINPGGIMQVPGGSDLVIGNQHTLSVNNSGILNIQGEPGNYATVRGVNSSEYYYLSVFAGGTIASDYCMFRYLTSPGVLVNSGSTVDPAHAFRGCQFFDGYAGGTLLRIENNQSLTIRDALFPTNTWGGASNVTKTVNQGQVYFVDYTGAFSGENYDNDVFGRINWVPTLSVDATATPASICTGGTSQLNANVTGGLGPFTYLWSPSGSLSDPASNQPVASPSATTTYSVVVTDALGSSATDQVTVTVNPLLPVSVSIVASANPVPTGTFVTFTATPVNGGAMPAYQWRVNGIPVGSGLPTYTYTPANNDQVWCILTSSEPCVSGNPATSNTILMTVIQENTTVNGIVPAPLVVCFDALNTITVAGSGTTFIVQNGASATLIAGQKILFLEGTLVEPGGYLHGYITTTNTYCGMLPPAMVAVVTGVKSPTVSDVSDQGSSRFSIFPNPTTGRFTLLAHKSFVPGMVQVDIFGMRGERIRSERIYLEHKLEQDLSGVVGGIYFVRIGTGDSQEVHKLVLTR